MYACMHGWMYVCMHGWMDGWMHGCMHVCMYVCMPVCMDVYMYINMYIYILCNSGVLPSTVGFRQTVYMLMYLCVFNEFTRVCRQHTHIHEQR